MRCDTSMKGNGNMSEARKGMLLVIQMHLQIIPQMCPFADAHVREVLHRQRRHFAALRGECFFIQRTFRHSRDAVELHQKV